MANTVKAARFDPNRLRKLAPPPQRGPGNNGTLTGFTWFGVRGTTHLLDMDGRVVRTWPVGTNCASAISVW